MEMSYYFSGTVHDFLFSGVNVVTTWGMISLCIGLVSLSLLSEGFKVARSLLLKLATSSPCESSCSRYNTSQRLSLLSPTAASHSASLKMLYHRRVKFHVLQTFLHMIHLTIGYILMLAVMTYNAYFTFAVVGGAGLGYYCFALFDLPSKILGTLSSRPARRPAGSSLSQEPEGVLSVKEDVKTTNECLTTTKFIMPVTDVVENGVKKESKPCEEGHNCEKQPLHNSASSIHSLQH